MTLAVASVLSAVPSAEAALLKTISAVSPVPVKIGGVTIVCDDFPRPEMSCTRTA